MLRVAEKDRNVPYFPIFLHYISESSRKYFEKYKIKRVCDKQRHYCDPRTERSQQNLIRGVIESKQIKSISEIYWKACAMQAMLASHGGICTNGLKKTDEQRSEDT